MGKMLADRYELGDELGAGGMGRVLRAHDQRLDRPVAIKFLHEDADDVNHARMEAEARMAGSLQHPGIAQVFDYAEDTEAGSPASFIVMQLIEGESLAKVLHAEGTLSPDSVARLVTEIADALYAAHSAGVVHRDLKPANIIITPAGRPVLVDFGIARSQGTEPLTESGVLVGTADYISPEQASGRTATAASDLYSLGVVAHHCLTGRSPFRRETPIATALAHVRDSPPPIDTVPELADLVTQMLAKSPGDRPTSAHEVASRAAPLAGLTAPATLVPSPLADLGEGSTAPPPSFSAGPATGPMTGSTTGPLTGPITGPLTSGEPDLAPTTAMSLSPAGFTPDSPPDSPRRSLRRVLVGLIAAIVTLSALLFGGAVFSGDPEVPDVVGLEIESARRVLENDGFTVRVERVDSPTIGADLVVSQDPPAATITENEIVTINVSTGQVTIHAEDLLGQPYEDAASALEELGLSVTRDEATSSDVAGTVVAIDLTGRVDIGATVTLTVARAPTVSSESSKSSRADNSSPASGNKGNNGRGNNGSNGNRGNNGRGNG